MATIALNAKATNVAPNVRVVIIHFYIMRLPLLQQHQQQLLLHLHRGRKIRHQQTLIRSIPEI